MLGVVAVILVFLTGATLAPVRAGLWGGHGHGVDRTCDAMYSALEPLVDQRCDRKGWRECEVQERGLAKSHRACRQIIHRCPSGVSYTLGDGGSWRINCAPE